MTPADDMQKTLELLVAQTAKISQQVESIEQRFDRLEGRIERLEAHGVRVDDRLEAIETNMATKMDLARTRGSLEAGQNLILQVLRGHTEQLGAIPPALLGLDRRVSTLEPVVRGD